ncbi:MAG: acyltransferase [Flavobacterium sp.]|nr:MAG: acyltransferase [Flavobacterium sp.]
MGYITCFARRSLRGCSKRVVSTITKSPLTNERITYYSELDALRAVAVTLTLLAHYLGRVGFKEIPYLWLGVDVFFVLSGFLITGILLKIKPVEIERIRGIKIFFIRRVLRLFPAYYLLITVYWIALKLGNLYIWNENYDVYFFTYIPNWFFFLYPEQNSGSFNHMWSLGVEEQFYLIWPWIILYLPKKFLRNLLLVLIGVSIVLRVVFLNVPNFTMLPISNLHTLGSGALLSYFYFEKPESAFFKRVSAHRQILFLIALSILVSILVFLPRSIEKSILSDLLVSFSASILVLCCVKGWSGPLKMFSSNNIIQYIGKISYGIYLYHMPIPDTIIAIGKFAGLDIKFQYHPYLWLGVFFILVFCIAHFSFILIEKRFLKMKPAFVKK